MGKMAAETSGDEGTAEAPLVIAGTEGMVVNYARCCHPIPGDDIIGYMSSGRGLVVHRADCGNVGSFRKQPAKWINVLWKRNVKLEFQAGIVVRTLNRMGLLAEMATVIAAAHCDLDHVAVETDSDSSTMEFLLRVRDRNHLARVIRAIRGMPDVVRITRTIPTKRS
jgi:guanosine-3',5'-bis(diphosphate) 3'-pyrophosphohydrolase